MNQSSLNIDSYPSKSQKLLLKAVFAPQQELPLAWEKWYSNVDIEDLDGQSYHLLAPLYYKISEYQLKIEEEQRLKGIYRRQWYNNNIYLKGLNQILETFNNHQIKTIILGDLGINLGYYPELAIRSIHNYELFVLPKQANLAIELLIKLGWKPKFKIDKINGFLYPKLTFTNNQNKTLFLYWQLWTNQLNINNQEAIFAEITKKITIGDYDAYVLNSTEQIINICLENVLLPAKMQICWLTDLKYIISLSNSEIDWQKLLEKIEKLSLGLSFKNLIKGFDESFKGIIPDDIIVKVEKIKSKSIELEEFKVINSNYTQNFSYKLKKLYLTYFRTSAQSKKQFNLIKFIYYVQYMWGLKSPWEIFKVIKNKLFNVLKTKKVVFLVQKKSEIV